MICMLWYGYDSFPYNTALIRKWIWTHPRALCLECHWSLEEFFRKTSDVCPCCYSNLPFFFPLRPRWKVSKQTHSILNKNPGWNHCCHPSSLQQKKHHNRGESGRIWEQESLIQNGPSFDQCWSMLIQLDPTCGVVRYIDNACMQVIQKPSFFDVVATGTEPVSWADRFFLFFERWRRFLFCLVEM